MRFPSDTALPAAAPAEPAEIGPKVAVTPVQRIGDGVRGVAAQPARHEAVAEEGAERPPVERLGEDRRRMCRRIYHLPVLLDTRSGEERRKAARRDGDPQVNFGREV